VGFTPGGDAKQLAEGIRHSQRQWQKGGGEVKRGEEGERGERAVCNFERGKGAPLGRLRPMRAFSYPLRVVVSGVWSETESLDPKQ
jgi:hypothetical protein